MEELGKLVDYGVIGVLIFMSLIAITVALERFWFLYRVEVKEFRSREELESVLTKGLHIIASVATTAPYVGLLGTVLGIMVTFHRIGEEGLVRTGEVMVGLALALKATAAGLGVAIPSTLIYNLLLRRVKVLIYRWEAWNGGEGTEPDERDTSR